MLTYDFKRTFPLPPLYAVISVHSSILSIQYFSGYLCGRVVDRIPFFNTLSTNWVLIFIYLKPTNMKLLVCITTAWWYNLVLGHSQWFTNSPYLLRKYEFCLISPLEMDQNYTFYVKLCGQIPNNISLLVVYYHSMMITDVSWPFQVI